MPEPIGEKFREFQSRSTEVQDIDKLFPSDDEEEQKRKFEALGFTKEQISDFRGSAESNPDKLTPERIAGHWERLSPVEKKFALAPQEQFDRIIDKYEETHGEIKANRIWAFRKLIQSGDPRAARINL